MPTLAPGVSATTELVVAIEDTAAAVASGAVEVLATPRLIALLEEAAFQAVQPLLSEGQTTVGTRVDVRHLAATPVGSRVIARAELIAVEERILRFRLEAHDTHDLVMEGTHERAIVSRSRFLERVAQKAEKK